MIKKHLTSKILTYIMLVSYLERGNFMEEKRKARIIFHKAGNGKSAKITLPIPWLRELEISEEEREVNLWLDKDTKKITIEKANK